MNDSIVDCALCGIGAHAFSNLFPAILLNPAIQPRYVVTRSKQKFEDCFRYFPNSVLVPDMGALDPSVTLIVASGPPEFNSVAIEFAETNSIPIFVEKPFPRRNVDPQLFGHVGYNLTFAPAVRGLLEKRSEFGPIINLTVTYCTNKPRERWWNCDSIA
jgi:hypothetical protein